MPAIGALLGLGALWLEDRRVLIMLVPALAVYLLFMGLQGRYFGRWLMPIVPLICVLAAYAALRLSDLLASRVPRAGPAIALALGAAVYGAGTRLLDSRRDRRLARRHACARPDLARRARAARHRVVIEPVVPEEWGLDIGIRRRRRQLPLAGFPVLRRNERDGKLTYETGPAERSRTTSTCCGPN